MSRPLHSHKPRLHSQHLHVSPTALISHSGGKRGSSAKDLKFPLPLDLFPTLRKNGGVYMASILKLPLFPQVSLAQAIFSHFCGGMFPPGACLFPGITKPPFHFSSLPTPWDPPPQPFLPPSTQPFLGRAPTARGEAVRLPTVFQREGGVREQRREGV